MPDGVADIGAAVGAPAWASMWVRAPITATADMVTVIAPITVMTATPTAPAGITAGIKPCEPPPGGAKPPGGPAAAAALKACVTPE